MAKAIRMPLLSDTMTEGKIIQWNKKVGDKVKSDDTIAEVETDKATMDVVGYEEGTLLYIGVKEGNAAKVNDIIAIVGKEGEDYQSLLNEGGKAEQKKESPKKEEDKNSSPAADKTASAELPKGAKVIRMPLLSDTMTEGKIIQWNKKVGDKVKSDDALAEVETDKATMDVVGYEEGTLLYIGVEAGQSAKVNAIIAIVGKEGTDVSPYVNAEKNSEVKSSGESVKDLSAPTAITTHEEEAESADSSLVNGRLKASPLAKKLAADKQ